jgi:hypothetical protein
VGEKEITIPTDPPLKVMLEISSGVSQTEIEEEVVPEEILIDNYLKQLREKREKITPWVYPYESIVDIPCKNSVTSLKKISELRRGTDRNRHPMALWMRCKKGRKGSLFHKIMEPGAPPSLLRAPSSISTGALENTKPACHQRGPDASEECSRRSSGSGRAISPGILSAWDPWSVKSLSPFCSR